MNVYPGIDFSTQSVRVRCFDASVGEVEAIESALQRPVNCGDGTRKREGE